MEGEREGKRKKEKREGRGREGGRDHQHMISLCCVCLVWREARAGEWMEMQVCVSWWLHCWRRGETEVGADAEKGH